VDELNDLINRMQHLSLSAQADPPLTAMAILSGPEIAIILKGLNSLVSPPVPQ
jgi:hypothetical protein